MDTSLRLLPHLKTLDLSFNNISVLDSLEACRELTHLNLANNSLCSVSNFDRFSGALRHLQLQVRCVRYANITMPVYFPGQQAKR